MTGVDKLQMIMCDVNVVAFTDKLIQPCSLPQLVSLCPQLFGQLRTVNCSGAHWWEKTMWLAFQLSHYCPRRKKINKDRERILNLLLKHPWLRFGVSPFSTSPSSAGPITNFYLTYSTLKVTTLVRWVSKTLLYHNSGFVQLPSSLLVFFYEWRTQTNATWWYEELLPLTHTQNIWTIWNCLLSLRSVQVQLNATVKLSGC